MRWYRVQAKNPDGSIHIFKTKGECGEKVWQRVKKQSPKLIFYRVGEVRDV